MAFPLHQGFQLDSLWSQPTVQRRPLFREIVLRIRGCPSSSCSTRSPWKFPSGSGVARCSSLSRLISCSAGVRVLAFSVTLRRRREAFCLSLQLLDMSHRRWSSFNASASLEFGHIHSLAAADFVTSKLLPGGIWTRGSTASTAARGLDLRSQCALCPACSQLLQSVSTDFGPTTP